MISRSALLATALSLSLAAGVSLAQPGSGSGLFHKEDKVVYAALGLGGLGGGYGNTTVPPIGVGLDYAFQDNLTAGGLVGFARSSFDTPPYDWAYSYFLIGARGAYHATNLIKDLPIDPYVAIELGYNIVTVSGSNVGTASGSYLFWGADLGARYWFTPKLGAQLELGYGLGVISLGIAYKL
jgi:hypothetical protein